MTSRLIKAKPVHLLYCGFNFKICTRPLTHDEDWPPNGSPVSLPLASIGGCQLIKIDRGRPSRLITVKSLGAEPGAVNLCKKRNGKQH